jgi:hypothetical protein
VGFVPLCENVRPARGSEDLRPQRITPITRICVSFVPFVVERQFRAAPPGLLAPGPPCVPWFSGVLLRFGSPWRSLRLGARHEGTDNCQPGTRFSCRQPSPSTTESTESPPLRRRSGQALSEANGTRRREDRPATENCQLGTACSPQRTQRPRRESSVVNYHFRAPLVPGPRLADCRLLSCLYLVTPVGSFHMDSGVRGLNQAHASDLTQVPNRRAVWYAGLE